MQGKLRHLSFPPLYQSWGGDCLAASSLSRPTVKQGTVYFIYLQLHQSRMAVFIAVVHLAWQLDLANIIKNKQAC